MQEMFNLVLFDHLFTDHHLVVSLTQLVCYLSQGDVLLAQDRVFVDKAQIARGFGQRLDFLHDERDLYLEDSFLCYFGHSAIVEVTSAHVESNDQGLKTEEQRSVFPVYLIFPNLCV